VVKVFLSFLILFSFSFAEDFDAQVVEVNPLHEQLDLKIRSLLDESVYRKNEAYINIIFSPESDFITNSHIDAVKVVETLKENGLLSLYFDKPRELILNFRTSDNPLFFMKIMGDTLRNIGYYRYVTRESKLDETGFTWSISLKAEYVTDPQILQNELNKSGSVIVDVTMLSQAEWTFSVDMRDGFLNVPRLNSYENIELKRSLYAYWIDVSEIKELSIQSSRRNSWYPYITYFDSSLRLLKVIKKDTRILHLDLSIPEGAKYIKISDIYTLKNIKNFLILSPKGSR